MCDSPRNCPERRKTVTRLANAVRVTREIGYRKNLDLDIVLKSGSDGLGQNERTDMNSTHDLLLGLYLLLSVTLPN